MSPNEQSIGWKHSYLTTFKANTEYTLSNVQYQILQYTFPTNSYVYKRNAVLAPLLVHPCGYLTVLLLEGHDVINDA